MGKKSLACLLILPLVWGCYYVASNLAVERMSVFAVGIVIRLVTMILLTLLMAARGQLAQLFHVRFVWKKLLLVGLLGFLLDSTAFLGLTYCPAGIGTVILKTDVIFVNLISVFVYHDRFKLRNWALTLVMLAGIVLVLGIDFGNVEIGGAGNLFFVASALFVSINAFVIKSAQHDRKNPVSDNVVAYYNNFVTLILFTIAAAAMGDMDQLAALGRDTKLTAALSAASFGQTLIYLLYYYNLRRCPVWLVKVFLLLVPVVAAVVGFFLFGQKLGALQLIGMVAVLACAGGIVAGQREKNPEHEILPLQEELK